VTAHDATGGDQGLADPPPDHPGLRGRSFRLLLAARSVDVFGTALAPLSLGFAILDLGGGASEIGLVVGGRSSGILASVIMGGVLADRYSRSVVLVYSNMLAAISQALIVVLMVTGRLNIPVLFLLALMNGASDGVSLPAASALTPDVVPRTLIPRANALLASATSTSRIAGLLGGTALVVVIGPAWALAIDAATFAIAALCFRAIPSTRTHNRTETTEQTSFLSELVAGSRLLRELRWVWLVILGWLVFNLANAAVLTVLGPAVTDETYGRSFWGIALAVQAAGIVAIGLIVNRLKSRLKLSRSLLFGAGVALLSLAFGLDLPVPVTVIAALVSGLSLGYMNISWDSNLQAHIPSEHLARIYSFDFFGSILAIPVGQVLAGPISDSIGLQPTLILAAAVTFLAFAILPLAPDIRRLDAPASE
jgi:MFS family permease